MLEAATLELELMANTKRDFGDRGEDDTPTGGGEDADGADAASGCASAPSLRFLQKKPLDFFRSKSLAELMTEVQACAKEASNRGKSVPREARERMRERKEGEKPSEKERKSHFAATVFRFP